MQIDLPESSSVLDLLEGGFRRIRILVVGDLMLDRYIVGDVERISPEAPVPVLRHVQRYSRLGGAANVAMNLAGLGVNVSLAGYAGNDADGEELKAILAETQIEASCILATSHPTISKTRIVGRTQHMLRLDVESRDALPQESVAGLLKQVHERLAHVDAVILSDYAKGVLSEEVCRSILSETSKRGIFAFVDPKTRDFSRYAGATTICPNLNELSAATGVATDKLPELMEAARELAARSEIDFLTVTMSQHGIRLISSEGEYHSPTRAQEVADVSGAGDTVIATLAAAIAGGLKRETAVELANLAAGIVVGKIGTMPVRAEEIISSITESQHGTSANKVLVRERAMARVQEWRAMGETIVFTNGCFDILHVGHITLLENCRRFGTKLVVALNTNDSVSRLKGPTRPIVGEFERAKVMAALGAVDAVVLFDEDTPLELIRDLKPDVLVKGGDYSVESVVGHELVAATGGRVEIVPIVEGFSTTNIVRKMAPQ